MDDFWQNFPNILQHFQNLTILLIIIFYFNYKIISRIIQNHGKTQFISMLLSYSVLLHGHFITIQVLQCTKSPAHESILIAILKSLALWNSLSKISTISQKTSLEFPLRLSSLSLISVSQTFLGNMLLLRSFNFHNLKYINLLILQLQLTQLTHKQMNAIKEKFIPQRNITPNFIRFKRKNSNGKPTTPEQNNREDQKHSQRSSSKASRCSFEVYEKRILNLSKLKANLNSKRKVDQKNTDSLQKRIIDIVGHKRTNSHDKDEGQRQNLVSITQRTNDTFLSRKKGLSGSGSNLKPYSRDKYSNPKHSQESLQKEEQRARHMNAELINNLMTTQNAPNYINKLKIKKTENIEKRKNVKKKLLNCNVEIKNEEAIKFYQIFGELGKGAYGTVHMGIDRRTGEKVAVKRYQKKRLDQVNKIKNLQRQINILSILDHPIIAKLIETIQTANQIFLILEYGGANSLYNYLLSKPEHRLLQSEAKQFFKTIAETLNYLHSMDIVHRDIKAENILLNRHKHLKLIDFGFSLQSKPPATIDTFCGTPTYMAPEIVSKRDHVPVYTDMWSMGILYYVLLQGNYPFRAKSQAELFQKIRQGHFEYIHDDISHKSKQLIESLLKVNPLQRLTIKQVLTPQYLQWYDKN